MYVPWTNKFDEQDASRDYVKEFELFLKCDLCPMSVKIGYDRAKTQYEQKTWLIEPTERKETINYELFTKSNDESVEEIVALASALGCSFAEDGEYFYGTDETNWCEQHYQV